MASYHTAGGLNIGTVYTSERVAQNNVAIGLSPLAQGPAPSPDDARLYRTTEYIESLGHMCLR